MHVRDTIEPETIQTQWRWERIGWALIAVVVVAAALGLFGGGPISKATATAAQGDVTYEVEYEKWNRMNHVSLLIVRVHAPGATGDLNVTFSREMAEITTIRSSSPSAEGGLGPDGILYGFPVDDWSAPVTVSMEYIPETVGREAPVATLQAGDLAPVRVRMPQFIYP